MEEPFVPVATHGATEPRDSTLTSIRERLFGIDEAEASFARRGFAPTTPACQQRLEQIGRCFVAGYNAAIRTADPVGVVIDLGIFADELRGFAVEGAAMGFALLDVLTPWPSRCFGRFLTGAACPHVFTAYVGAGLALARTSVHLAWRLGPLDPLLRWLMFDGYGFHAGYFQSRDMIDRQRRVRALHGYARNVFDQGLGRAIWFAKGADIHGVATAASDFAEHRHAEVWSGIGLAAAYAGGVDAAELSALAGASGPYRVHLGQGAAFAAKARQRAGNPAPHTELACLAFCGLSAAAAAAITDQAVPSVGPGDRGEAYQAWRADIRRWIGVHLAEAAS
jgi:hypothetical protein